MVGLKTTKAVGRQLVWKRLFLFATIAAILSGCTPRFEAWRIDRADGTSSLVIKREAGTPQPMLWQLDVGTADLDSGRRLTVADLIYLCFFLEDRQQVDKKAFESGRFCLGLTRDGFERFLVASLGRPPKNLPENQSRSYRGTLSFSRRDGLMLADLHYIYPDGTGWSNSPSDIYGEIACTILQVP